MNDSETPIERVLWSARPSPSNPAWAGLHDQVMGGRSQGSAQPQAGEGTDPDHVLFSGAISRANGGGFASFRPRLPTPVTIGAAHTVTLTLRGDGGPIKLCLHRQSDWDGVQWQTDFLASATRGPANEPEVKITAREALRQESRKPGTA